MFSYIICRFSSKSHEPSRYHLNAKLFKFEDQVGSRRSRRRQRDGSSSRFTVRRFALCRCPRRVAVRAVVPSIIGVVTSRSPSTPLEYVWRILIMAPGAAAGPSTAAPSSRNGTYQHCALAYRFYYVHRSCYQVILVLPRNVYRFTRSLPVREERNRLTSVITRSLGCFFFLLVVNSFVFFVCFLPVFAHSRSNPQVQPLPPDGALYHALPRQSG